VSFRRAAAKAMKSLPLIAALTLVSGAEACPEGQYESCLGERPGRQCVCLPNGKTFDDHFGKLNPLPDTLKTAAGVRKGDAKLLSERVGALIIEGTCQGCPLLAQNLMSKPNTALVEQIVGRGWLLFETGIDPILITADAARSLAAKWDLSKPDVSPSPALRQPKTFRAKGALCIVQSEQKQGIAGFVKAPRLVDDQTKRAFIFRKRAVEANLVPGDTLIITASGDAKQCAAVPEGQTLLKQAKIRFEYYSFSMSSPTTMNNFLVGTVE